MTEPLRIGVVPFLDGSGGGIYQYSATMLDGLLAIEPRPQLVLFVDRRSRERAEPWRARGYEIASLWPTTLSWKLRDAASRVAGRRHARKPVIALPALGEWISRFGIDFLVFPAPSMIGFQSGLPYVMAVHDLQHRIHPEFPEVSADGEWEHRESLFRNGVGHALTVLVDSEVGRDDVMDCYGDVISAERVAVLPFLPASYLDATAADAADAGPAAVRERLALPERYLFFPAQFWPHKNHVRVVRALALIRSERGVDVNVVMCGSATDPLRASILAEVRRTAADEGVEDLVQILGYVEDDLMAPLYAGSRGMLLPTFFGPTNIPVLEAWAIGVPVLTSDVRGIREQCSDAAVLVEPTSVRAIADGIYSLWSDERLRGRLVATGTRRLAAYGRSEYVAQLSAIVRDAGRRVRDAAPAPPGRTKAPTVSVIIPAYNRARSVAAAIESVSNQSFEALEIIVVDDGSSDETADIATAIAKHEPRLRVLSHPHNRGAPAARNTGIRAAQGDWVAFLDADDTYYPDSLRLRLDEARRTGHGVVHSACEALTADGTRIPFAVPPLSGHVYRALLTAPAPTFPGLLVKREILERIGPLSEAAPAYQEWDTSIRLAAISDFGFVETPTFLYDLGTQGAISRDTRRGIDGYGYVVSRHWREVMRVAGPRVLASHYRIMAEMRSRAGQRRAALRCVLLSQLIWPLSPRVNLRLLRRVTRSRADMMPL